MFSKWSSSTSTIHYLRLFLFFTHFIHCYVPSTVIEIFNLLKHSTFSLFRCAQIIQSVQCHNSASQSDFKRQSNHKQNIFLVLRTHSTHSQEAKENHEIKFSRGIEIFSATVPFRRSEALQKEEFIKWT